jgi:tetratricopeptide (TPR) repeat protein
MGKAEVVCEEGLSENRALGDRRGIAIALQNLGWASTVRGDHERACSLLEESLRCRRAIGDSRGTSFTMTTLAWAELKRQRLNRASELLKEARPALERLDDRQLLAWALTIDGLVERAAGRPATARERFTASIKLWRSVGNLFGLAFTLVGDAEAALDQTDHAHAAANLGEAVPLLRRTGVCWGLGDALMASGRLAEFEEARERAAEFYSEALIVSLRLGDPSSIQECRQALARVNALL